MKKFLYFIGIISLIYMSGCTPAKVELENGIWRGVFKTDSAIEIPFNFEVYDSAGTKQIAFLNAKERLNISEVSLVDDSVIIRTPLYETEIRAQLNADGMSGTWTRNFPDRVQHMPFEAKPNVDWRFMENPRAAKENIADKWSVLFRNDNGDTTSAIGEFVQDGSKVSGTFLTDYGDYRFLQGEIDGDILSLSAYAGSSPSLFVATVSKEGIIGDMYSGPNNHRNWEAKRDENAMLADAYQTTRLKADLSTIAFNFEDTEGNMVSLKDERYKGKVVIVQFLGSWCPNCMDETAYLSPFYDKYKNKGVEILGLAYERYAEPERAKKAVVNLIDRFQVTYPVLLTGYTNKNADVLESIPGLENFNAFPTTIIIDKKGNVRTIHSGFTGPATGQAYVDYTNKFESTINELLKES
jgi:thiol-disulfide isomerase/thioredoxin